MTKENIPNLIWSFIVFLIVTRVLIPYFTSLRLDKLSPADCLIVDSILAKLEPVLSEKGKQGTLALLSFPEMSIPLNPKEKDFIQKILRLQPKKAGIKLPFRGIKPVPPDLVKISGQPVKASDGSSLGTVYLPPGVAETHEAMMKAMEKDLGKRLYVKSAYRAPAYQLYLFLFYLKKRNYSILETAKWNALPGYSEHGDPDSQALDFISEKGVDDDLAPEAFEALPEYGWLLKNAGRFGFELSYPKNNPSGIGFEPWHWRFCGSKCLEVS